MEIKTDYSEPCPLECGQTSFLKFMNGELYFKCDKCNQDYTTTLLDTINELLKKQNADTLDKYIFFLIWLYEKGLINDYDFDFEKVSKRYVKSITKNN